MSIDTNALTSINNAISSSKFPSQTNTIKTQQDQNANYISLISKAAAEHSTSSRFKAEFEEKMKIANGTTDDVEISDKSLEALKKYQKNEVSSENSKDASSSNGYTYDYQAIKKKNLENLAKIEKEVSEKYGKKETQSVASNTDDTTKASETASTDTTTKVTDDSTTKSTTTTAASTDSTQSTTATSTTATKSTDSTESKEATSRTYGYDYNSMKEQDAKEAAKIEQEVQAKYGKKAETPVETALS